MNLVWGTSQTPDIREGLTRFIGNRVRGGHRGFGNCVALGMFDEGKILGAMVFHDWNPESGIIEFTGASESPRWLSRRSLWAMFNYAFNEIGCRVVVMRVDEDNAMWNGRGIQRILKAYGFQEHRLPELARENVALMVYSLTKSAFASNGFHRQNAKEARLAA